MDIISILLGVIVVLIFMAIFTLLRTMNSPYIQRFETLLKSKLESIPTIKDSYCLRFNLDGRNFGIYEMNFETIKGQKTVYNKIIYLKAETRASLSLRFLDHGGSRDMVHYFEGTLGVSSACYDVSPEGLDLIFSKIKVLSNDPSKTLGFLQHREVSHILSDFKVQSETLGNFIPVAAEPGLITFHYSLNADYLNELNNNPRLIARHAEYLNILARELELLEFKK